MKTIYVSLDLRRALHLENQKDLKILCAHSSDFINDLRQNGSDIWCFEEEVDQETLPNSTAQLISHPKVLQWLRKQGKNLRFIVFKNSGRIQQRIEKENWEILSTPSGICRILEDKIAFAEKATEFNIPLADHQIISWSTEDNQNKKTLKDISKRFSWPLVLQTRHGHAGNNTWLLKERESLPPINPGSKVKVSQYLDGPTFTWNAWYSSKHGLQLGSPWVQLRGKKDWNSHEMGTVGIAPLSKSLAEKLKTLQTFWTPLEQLLKDSHYSSWFGIDVMISKDRLILIELNARLTASVSLQAKEENYSGNGLWTSFYRQKNLNYSPENRLGQIILRNTKSKPWKIPRHLRSGIYQINPQNNWERIGNVTQKLEAHQVLLILSQKPGDIIASDKDYATLISLDQKTSSQFIAPEICIDFYERFILQYIIRQKDWIKNQYIKLKEDLEGDIAHYNWFLYSKPLIRLDNIYQKNFKGLNRFRQNQVFPGENLILLAKHHNWVLGEKKDGSRGWFPEFLVSGSSNKEFFEQTSPFKTPPKTHNEEQFFSQWINTPYLYGANSREGIDCSAFLQRYFWNMHGILLPKHSQSQRKYLRNHGYSSYKNEAELVNGDIIFYEHKHKALAHVGIFWKGFVYNAHLKKGVSAEKPTDLLKNLQLIEVFRVQKK